MTHLGVYFDCYSHSPPIWNPVFS